jgi:hypothetical protein
LYPTAKRLNALSHRRYINVLLCLSIQLAQVLHQTLLSLRHLLSFPFERVSRDHFAEV